MRKFKNKVLYLTFVLCMISMMLLPVAVYAQDILPPDDPEGAWTPPENDGAAYAAPGVKAEFDKAASPVEPSTGYSTSQSSSYYPYPPYPPAVPVIISTSFIDESGNVRTRFESELFYLRLQINTPGLFYIAEYFPAGSGLSPHWLMYGYKLDRAGIWNLGPFYPDVYEPKGQHTWKMWLYASGNWAQKLARFDYRPAAIPFTVPSLEPVRTGSWSTMQIILVMVLVGALGVTVGMLISNRRRYGNPA